MQKAASLATEVLPFALYTIYMLKINHGDKFNRLTVIRRFSKPEAGKNIRYLCRCDCGTESIVESNRLICGETKSCGCLSSEITTKRNTTHGLSRTPAYKSWSAMRHRCLNENASDYAHYGGRGITVCKRWMKFENFYKDMGDRPYKTGQVFYK